MSNICTRQKSHHTKSTLSPPSPNTNIPITRIYSVFLPPFLFFLIPILGKIGFRYTRIVRERFAFHTSTKKKKKTVCRINDCSKYFHADSYCHRFFFFFFNVYLILNIYAIPNYSNEKNDKNRHFRTTQTRFRSDE